MIARAESLFGPYVWERYDMLVLPPSFPYGGMENPRMTFLTPTVLAGDRSLVDVVAHELAHAWTGNLVTNATMEHFWLNEGFTTWAERRILTALHGDEVGGAGVGHWAACAGRGRRDALGVDSPLTRLRLQLHGVDPDEAFSTIPTRRARALSSSSSAPSGAQRFEQFLRDYMHRFQFQSITSEEFLQFLDAQLPGTSEQVLAQQWLYETGMPAACARVHLGEARRTDGAGAGVDGRATSHRGPAAAVGTARGPGVSPAPAACSSITPRWRGWIRSCTSRAGATTRFW